MAKTRAFVVEDNPVILEHLSAALTEMADVDVVGSAPDEGGALAWLGTPDACDVVIIDIFLRSGSGLGVLKGIRDLSFPLERVVLTNYATDDVRTRCKALGAEAVFDKSRELEELFAWFAARSTPH